MERQRVLIVDDHTGARAALRTMVGHDPALEVVGEAVNGLEAIKAVGQLAPDLVLMDITMPGMNGIPATAEIKRRYADVRVLIVSLHDDDEYVRASAEAGADGYIRKDAGRDEFRMAIRNAVAEKAPITI